MPPAAQRWTTAYSVVYALLVVALATAGVLLARLVTASTTAVVTVADPTAVDCPAGERATACYRFEVTNQGPHATMVRCRLDAGDAIGEFLSGGPVYEFASDLPPGASLPLIAKVIPTSAGTAFPPEVSCSALG